MFLRLVVLATLDGCGHPSPAPSAITYIPARVAVASRRAIHVAAGDTHTCAIMDDATVACWGDNYNHQFGDGTTDSSLRPTVIVALRGSTQIAAGGTNTCVWRGGRMHCSGTGEYYPPKNDRSIQTGVLTIPAGYDGVSSVSLASGHRCMRTTDGTAQCFGENRDGQLGPGVGVLVVHPRVIDGIAGVAEVASSYSHSCARTDAGDVWCWGANRSGELGDGTMSSHPAPVRVTGLGGRASQIATGGDKSCAVMVDGTVRCWGMDRAVGRGDCMGRAQLTPSDMPGLGGVVQIVLGWSHACVRLSDGTVRCWGSDQDGRLGVGGKTENAQQCTYSCMFGCTKHDTSEKYLFHPAPVTVDGLADIVELTAGHRHTCARSGDGRVWCWGENGAGQIGDGTTVDRNVPTQPAW